MNALLIPILVPFFAAIVLTLVPRVGFWQKAISAASCLGVTGFVYWLLFFVNDPANGIQATIVGGWEAPYGIAFVADRLACIMLCLSMTVGSVVLSYTFWTATEKQQRLFFYPMFQIVLAGVNWAFLSGDIFNLFVAYEVMLIGSYGMMMVGGGKAQVRQTMKYIAINGVGSTLFVVAVGLIYATTGTLNMADLAWKTAELEGAQAGVVTACSLVLLTVFAMKAASFPLFFWLPDSYPIVPSGVNGYYAGLLTKVGVYSLLRVFVMVFRQDGAELAMNVVLVLSGFTMLFGVLGAMCQWDIRKILSWHIISQVGYMLMGIGLAGSANKAVVTIAIAGTVFYIVHHIVVKSCLFLVGGIAERVSGTQKLKEMGGVIDMAPGLALLFLIASFSLAGMPPFSGFLSKFVLVRAGLAGEAYFIVFVSVATSFLTLYSMTKIWSYAFWGKNKGQGAGATGQGEDDGNRNPGPVARLPYKGMMVPTAVLVVFTVFMGMYAQPFMELAESTAEEIMNPDAENGYIQRVMAIEMIPEEHHGQGHGDHDKVEPHDGDHARDHTASDSASPIAQSSGQDSRGEDLTIPAVSIESDASEPLLSGSAQIGLTESRSAEQEALR